MSQIFRAKSTDRGKLTENKLTANQRFRHSDFVILISSQSEGLGKKALGIVKYFWNRPTQPIGVVRGQFVHGQFVHGQFVSVSCRGPQIFNEAYYKTNNL